MKIRLLLTFFLLSISKNLVFSQQNLLDKINVLKKELSGNISENKKAQLYSDLTWYYSSVSVDSAIFYGNKAVKASIMLKDSTLLAQVYSDIGAVHFRNNDFKKSEKFYLDSYKIRKQKKDAKGIAKLNNNLASVYRNLSQPQKSMNMYLEALHYFESVSDEENVNVAKANIGVIFKDLKNFKNAEKYLQEAISYFKSTNNETRLCENYMNLGNVYQLQKNFGESEKFYNLSKNICGKIGNTQAVSYVTRNLAAVYKAKKNDSASIMALQESENARKKFNSKLDLASLNIEYANNLLGREKYLEAKKKFITLKNTFEKENSPEDLAVIYKDLSNTYSYLGIPDSSAFYFNKYIDLNDKILNKNINKQTAELETKYQTSKKDNEILEQKSKILKRNIEVFSLLGLLALGLIYYRNYQHRQKLKLQKTILHQQDLATKAVINAEDNERKRMAIHLHDGVGQLLTATNMNLEVLDEFKNDEEAFGKVIEKTKNILKEAMSEVRTLSHQIMPNMLIKNSLSNALKELVEKTNSPKLHLNLKIEGLKDNLDENIQIVMFRVIQECINNTIKHADASEVMVNVFQNEKEISAEFQDNGKGFSMNDLKSDGMGIENIRSRIEFLKGSFMINSKEGQGTKINVKIPL